MGLHKSEQRKALEKANVIELLRNYTLLEISKMFNTSVMTVNTVATEQFTKREINNFENSREKVEFLGTKGAWAELKSTQLYKQIMNERNK